MTAFLIGCKQKPLEYASVMKSVKSKNKKSLSYIFDVAHEEAIIIRARIIVYFKIVLDQLDSNIIKVQK